MNFVRCVQKRIHLRRKMRVAEKIQILIPAHRAREKVTKSDRERERISFCGVIQRRL